MLKKHLILYFIITLILGICLSTNSYAQEDEEDLLDFLDTDDLSEDDSLAIFLLLDDILSDETPKSKLKFRAGYGSGSSSIVNAATGRQNTYTSLSYYHKSGMSLDLTGNFSR